MDELGSPGPGMRSPASPKRRIRQALPRPDHFSVKDDGSSLRIRCCWIWRRFTGPATMCFLWNSFFILWFWNAVRNGGPFMWLAIIFCIPHGAIGLLLVYYTLGGLLNRTVIKVTSEFLTVRNGPVPWWGNRQLPIDDLERLYCDTEPDPEKHGWTYVYRVIALTTGGCKIDLVTELDRAQALFVKQELVRWLKIGGQGAGGESHIR